MFMSKWNRLGLQRRIMAYVTIGLLVLFAGLAYFNVQALRDARDQVFRERLALANSLAQDLNQDFEFLASDMRMAAEGIRPAPGDFPAAALRIFQALDRHAPSQFFRLTSVSIMDEEGRLLGAEPQGLPPSPPAHADLVQTAMRQNRSPVLCSSRAAEGDGAFAAVVVPVVAGWTNGRRLAAVADTVGVSGTPPAIPGGGTGYSMEILGADGRTIISTSEPERVGQVSVYYPAMSKYAGERLGGVEMHSAPEGAPGDDEVIALSPLPSAPYYLVLKQPAGLALMVPHQRQNEMLVVGVTGLFLALGVAWYTTRSVVRPVTELRATARAFARGSLETPVRVSAQDELGELAEDIETMRQQLKSSRDGIEEARRELEVKVAERTQRLQETLGKTITAQEEERRRLARELHDEQSQTLGALSVSLDRISRLLGPGSSQIHQELEQARNMALSLLRETRRLIYDLRPSVLDDMGLEAAIRWCAETHLECHGMEVTLKSSLPPGHLPAAIEAAMFRVAQESIVNIERHSQARHAGVELERRNSSVRVTIWDDGKGFVPPPGNGGQTHGVGLEGMEERVRLMGGRLEVRSAPGRGTTIIVEVPLD